VLSNTCLSADCASTALQLYDQSSHNASGLDAVLHYGDSRTGTHAFGVVGQDEVSFAGFTLDDQHFAAINDTDTNVLEMGSTGILGLGFPLNSIVSRGVWGILDNQDKVTHGDDSDKADAEVDQDEDRIIHSFPSIGPFLTRIISQGKLAQPMFTITLQRDYVAIGGNAGMLSIGALPSTVSNDSLTWVPIRMYQTTTGGLADGEDDYPLTWEVFLDGVYLDGEELPKTSLTLENIKVSALLDTGNSMIRGPQDVIREIRARIGLQTDGGGTFDCDEPHELAFKIGGEMFRVDARDLISQAYVDSVEECVANVAVTDSPTLDEGDRLHSWSLGDPFLKG
jgi:hypothetical protein